MEVYHNVNDLKHRLLLKTGFTIGFVPTMGALHQGHISLVKNSSHDNDITVVSIFVNPKQFNDPKDLEKYPRNTEQDLQLLENSGCDIVFIPDVEEIYPDKEEESFSFGHLEEVMEGKHRPGHFNGVAQVVSRLFRIVSPTKAYFGRKDFQQLAIIKKMVDILDFQIEIVSCPIIREKDGLAMSSRNVLLKEDERKNASQISQTLFKARNFKRNKPINEIKNWVVESINKIPHLEVEYFELVDDINLMHVTQWDDKMQITGCIAVKGGSVRLIDNISF